MSENTKIHVNDYKIAHIKSKLKIYIGTPLVCMFVSFFIFSCIVQDSNKLEESQKIAMLVPGLIVGLLLNFTVGGKLVDLLLAKEINETTCPSCNQALTFRYRADSVINERQIWKNRAGNKVLVNETSYRKIMNCSACGHQQQSSNIYKNEVDV